MNEAPDRSDEAVDQAQSKLARLAARVESMQAVLVRLLQDVVRAESRLDHSRAAQLVEANEQLVLAALASQTDAEAAAQALTKASDSGALDPLTQLPTRTTLIDRFEQAAAHAKRHGSRVALLFLDLDGFKALNDEYGHPFGDQVLRRVAERLVSVVREVDTVSRHGGDEFLILLAELSQPQDAQAVAEKLLAAVGAPAELEGHAAGVRASVGIAVYPDDGEDVATLVARADAAMYEAKRLGQGGIAFHGTGPIEEPGLASRAANPTQRRARDGAGDAADQERRLSDLREANEKLVLAAITAHELQAAAEQSLRRQTAFLKAVADELRNPLAPIRIASTMLGRPAGDDPLLPRVKEVVEQQMANVSRLVGQLADASSTSPVDLALDRRRVDLAQVIARAVAARQPSMDERGQTFESSLPPATLDMEGDPARLEQIVGNLLDNASRHTHDGGRISLSVAVGDQTLTMTVADDGIGITPEMLPHVFEPFVQDTFAFGVPGAGLGIGLTVVRALVQAHGGSLSAHSEGPDRGSRFVVTLPLATGDAHAPAAGPAAGATDAGR